MKLLTKDTDYAIRAVIHLAQRPGAWVSSRSISKEEGIPLQFLRRLLLTLRNNGLIDTKEGVRGGVRLKSSPHKITVAQLIRIIQGEIKISQCLLRKRICPNRANCALRYEISKIEKMVIDHFERITIARLLEEVRRK